jgi:hypothetical protein
LGSQRNSLRSGHFYFLLLSPCDSWFPLAMAKFSIGFSLIELWGGAARFSHVRGLFFETAGFLKQPGGHLFGLTQPRLVQTALVSDALSPPYRWGM